MYSTIQIILSGVNLYMDGRMLDHNTFKANLSPKSVNKFIEYIIEMMK